MHAPSLACSKVIKYVTKFDDKFDIQSFKIPLLAEDPFISFSIKKIGNFAKICVSCQHDFRFHIQNLKVLIISVFLSKQNKKCDNIKTPSSTCQQINVIKIRFAQQKSKERQNCTVR